MPIPLSGTFNKRRWRLSDDEVHAIRERSKAARNAEHAAIRAAEPQPRSDGSSSVLLRRNPWWRPSGAPASQETGIGWQLTFSANRAYRDLPQNLASLRAAGLTDAECAAELLRRHGPAIPLAGYIFPVTPHRDRRLRQIMNAEADALWYRTIVVADALMRGRAEEMFHCFDFMLSKFCRLRPEPAKGVAGWVRRGGPDVAGMNLDYREPPQRMLTL